MSFTCVFEEIRRQEHPVLVQAATGTGKTTELPKLLTQLGLVIGVVPQRMAAHMCWSYVSRTFPHVAYETGEGGEKSSRNPKVIYMTAGHFSRWALKRLLSSKPLPEVVMLDEAHTWNSDYHLAATICKELHKKGVQLVYSSATINQQMLRERYDIRTSLCQVDAERPFPTTTHEVERCPPLFAQLSNTSDVVEMMVGHCRGSYHEHAVNLLVLPGIKEIKMAAAQLKRAGIRLPIKHLASVHDIIYKNGVALPAIYLATFGKVSSAITIPDLANIYVCGITKNEMSIEGITGIGPVPITREEHKQVIGRIGRVRPGRAFLFYNVADLQAAPSVPNFCTLRSLYISDCSALKSKMEQVFGNVSQRQLDNAFYSALPYEQALLVETVVNREEAYYLYALFLAAQLARTHLVCSLEEKELAKVLECKQEFFQNTGMHFLEMARNVLEMAEPSFAKEFTDVYDGDMLDAFTQQLQKYKFAHKLRATGFTPTAETILQRLLNIKSFEKNILMQQPDTDNYVGVDNSYLLKNPDGSVGRYRTDIHISFLPYAYRTTAGKTFLFSLFGLNLESEQLQEELMRKVVEIRERQMMANIMQILLAMEASAEMHAEYSYMMQHLGAPSLHTFDVWVDAAIRKQKEKQAAKDAGNKLKKVEETIRGGVCFCGENAQEIRDEPECCITECNHIFHKACLERWLDACARNRNKDSCPMCRAQVEMYWTEGDLQSMHSQKKGKKGKKHKKEKKTSGFWLEESDEEEPEPVAPVVVQALPSCSQLGAVQEKLKKQKKPLVMPPVFFKGGKTKAVKPVRV